MKEVFINGAPVMGVPIREPDHSIQHGDVLLGYKVIEKSHNIFMDPEPKKMQAHGWLSVAFLAFFCWPLMCLPCCMSCSYPDIYQVPVYGKPKRLS